MRTCSLKDISLAVADLGDPVRYYPSMMKQYLDEFVNMSPEQAFDSIREAPLPITPVLDVHIAGMAEYLAGRAGVVPPAWALQADRFFVDPVFFCGRRARNHALIKTNAAMRRRNLFCGEIILPEFKTKQPYSVAKAGVSP